MSDKKGVQPMNLSDYENPEGTGGQQAVTEKRGHTVNNAIYDGANNTAPNSAGVVGHTRDAAVDETHSVERITSVSGDNDKQALDVAISDSDGNKIDENNPLAVYAAESPADEVSDFDQAIDVAGDAGGVANHDYTVSAGKNFKATEVRCSSTNEGKFELQIEDGVAAGTFTAVDVAFTSASTPNCLLRYPVKVAAGIIVRIVKTNYHNKDTDMYSVIQGLEI